MYQNILRFARGRYAWLALALLVAAALIYSTQPHASGSTWQGMTLGVLGAALITWLAALGVRKRLYHASGLLQRWVSAHVYLGLALTGVVLLHTAGQVGPNVHTLALVLMLIVIASGTCGAYFYITLPRRISRNRNGGSRADLFGELATLNDACTALCTQCAPDIQLAVQSSISGTTIGGSWWDQLTARDDSTLLRPSDDSLETAQSVANRGQSVLLELVAARSTRAKSPEEARAMTELVASISRRQEVLRQIRRDVQFQSWLEAWLYAHIPFTFALLAALVVHIVVVFFYS